MKLLFSAFAFPATALLLTACGGQTSSESGVEPVDPGTATQLVKPSNRIFEIAVFEDAGLKHSKDYKTEGLPAAN